jgi:hypothetical protein
MRKQKWGKGTGEIVSGDGEPGIRNREQDLGFVGLHPVSFSRNSSTMV